MEESSCPTLDSEFAEIQRNNENLFAELTGGVPLPKDIPLTPVLSVVDTASSLNQLNNSLQLLDQDKDFMLPEEYQSQRATIQMYQFMLQNSHCSSSNCYWVANAPQGESNNFLVYTVKAAGMEFAGDPANKFNKLKQDFIQAQLEAEPNATEERKKEIRKAAEQAAPPYLPYSGKDIVKEGQENNPPAVYFSGAGDARSFIEANGYTAPIFYGEKGHEALSSQDNKTLKDRSSALVKHLAENVRLYGSISQTIQQNANQETVKNTIQPIMQDIRESVQKEMGNSGSLSPHR